MARVTIEDCLEVAPNRFALVHLAAKRAMQLKKEAEPLVDRVDNKEIVTGLREIAEGKVVFDVDVDDVLSGRIHKRPRRRAYRRTSRPRLQR
jgi:DNA-directed RNA polymerase subunit omega